MNLEFTPQVLALLGAATSMGGVALVVWGAKILAQSRSQGASESLLAPTLAVDTLDPDLRIAYMRTRVVDARESARNTASPIGRELRRGLVAVQAARFAGQRTPLEAQLLTMVDDVCDELSAHTLPEADRERRSAEARDLRRALLSKLEDLQL